MVESNQNLWHGSVNTSTDTLVPMQNSSRRHSSHSDDAINNSTDHVDAASKSMVDGGSYSRMQQESTREDRKSNGSINNHSSILPKVHSRGNLLSSNNSETSNSSGSLHNSEEVLASNKPSTLHLNLNAINNIDNGSSMDESIMILPEHQKLDISFSGNCESILNNVANATSSQAANNSFCTTTPSNYYAAYAGSSSSYTGYNGGGSASSGGMSSNHSQNTNNSNSSSRRRRTLSSHSRRELLHAHQNKLTSNGMLPTTTMSGINTRYSLSGATGGLRSLPLTPPGMPERQPIAISCPDGLSHALSEQNIRLQQIVHEHKVSLFFYVDYGIFNIVYLNFFIASRGCFTS